MKPESLASRLLQYLLAHKKITRTEVRQLAKKWDYMESNAERRMRELCEDYPIRPFDVDGKPIKDSSWIACWKLVGKVRGSVVFNPNIKF